MAQPRRSESITAERFSTLTIKTIPITIAVIPSVSFSVFFHASGSLDPKRHPIIPPVRGDDYICKNSHRHSCPPYYQCSFPFPVYRLCASGASMRRKVIPSLLRGEILLSFFWSASEAVYDCYNKASDAVFRRAVWCDTEGVVPSVHRSYLPVD